MNTMMVLKREHLIQYTASLVLISVISILILLIYIQSYYCPLGLESVSCHVLRCLSRVSLFNYHPIKILQHYCRFLNMQIQSNLYIKGTQGSLKMCP